MKDNEFHKNSEFYFAKLKLTFIIICKHKKKRNIDEEQLFYL